MTSVSTPQLTFNFEPSLPERWPTLREYIAHRVTKLPKPAKSIAADMDMSPSLLSRKLNPGEADTSRFNVDDLEAYLRETGDTPAIIEYLVAKFCDSQEARRERVLSKVESMLPELVGMLATLKAGTA